MHKVHSRPLADRVPVQGVPTGPRGFDWRSTEPATLVLLGEDYDGGTKAWIRWPDGSDDIVPGSQVELT